MLYELGLRDDDILQSMNGMPLTSVEDAYLAFRELYINDGETEYDLYVERESSNIHLYYVLVD